MSTNNLISQPMKSNQKTYVDSDNKPYPVRLGEMKKELMIEAGENDASLHYIIKKILQAHIEKRKGILVKIKSIRK